MPKTIVFDLDDFGMGDALEKLLLIKEHFPKFKCTMFMIPMNISLMTGDLTMDKYKEWAAIVKEYDWIELALHGFAHRGYEGDVPDAEKAEILVKGSENMMKELGLNPVKVWKSPYWVSSPMLYEYLRDNDYIVAIDKNQPIPPTEGMKKYLFNWSIDELMPDEEIVKAHGHCYGTANDIGLCLPNVMREMPADAEFQTITEYYAAHPCV